MNTFELIATLFAFTYVIFQILQKKMMWYLSIVTAVMYLWVYFSNSLFAMAVVQIYLICAGVYGILSWTQSKNNVEAAGGDSRVVYRKFDKKVGVISIALSLAVFFVLQYVLRISHDAHPWMDAALATNTMLATFYTGRQYMVSWIMWFVADVVSVVFYFKCGMYPTSVLFAAYVVMAVLGYINWKKHGVREDLVAQKEL
ncbi:MAG: nicotinamide mononucleotide transporter [Bacteroidales bacterium]|nr:nicotinamide mononucleotide transporter [Candidatus Equibacterium intestinale]